MTAATLLLDPGHAAAGVAAASGRKQSPPQRRRADRLQDPELGDPEELDPEDDNNDDYFLEQLSRGWSDDNVLFGSGFDLYDPSSTPLRPDSISEVQAASDLFTHLVTGATAENVARPLAHEIQHYDWCGADQRFVAGVDPTPFARWERDLDTNDFFTARSGAFNETQPSAPDWSDLLARPDESFTFAEVGEKFGYTGEEFEYILDGDASNLKRFAFLRLEHDADPELSPDAEPPDRRLELAPIPQPAPPAVTDPADAFRGSDRSDVLEQFRGTFPFYSAFLDPEGAQARIEKWQEELSADAKQCRGAAARGERPKSQFKRVEFFSADEFHPCLVGKQINCVDQARCFIEPDHDRPEETGLGIAWKRVIEDLGGDVRAAADGTIDWAEVIRNHPYADRQLLSDLMLGYDNRSRQPWCLALSPFNGSAAANLSVVDKAVGKGIDNDWLVESPSISALPFVAEPYGVAFKRHSCDPSTGLAKPRLTTDRSGPRDLIDPSSGSPVANNANINVKVDHPPMKLVTVPEIRQGLAVLSAGASRLARVVRADESLTAAERTRRLREVGQVHMGADDFAGYFSQLYVRHRQRSRQAMCLPRPDGRLSYTFSKRVTFGGSSAPQHAQRLTNAVLHRVQARLREEDRRIARDAERHERGAEGGHAFATVLAPRSLRELAGERRELGEERASLYYIDGYIDDVIMASVGQARTLIMMNMLWSTCDRFNLKLAPDKAVFGTRCTVIGFEFRLKSNRFSLTENRLHLFAAWLRRLRGLRGRRIAKAELRSLAGSLVWARPALPGAGQFYKRLFGLLNAPTRTLIQPPWLEFDLDQIEDVMNETNGVAMIRTPPPPDNISPAQVLWTDAAREISEPSAMGGFTTATGQLWKLTFDEQHVRHLPIHVLEAVGSVTALALAANSLRGQSVLVYCDNQAWVESVRGGSPKDPRLREILAVQNQICKQYDLKVHIKYVHTDTNIVADAASRHRMDEAIAELAGKGWAPEDISVLDLNAQPERGPGDLALLLDRMVQITVARTLHRKKLIEHTWA